MKQTSAAPAPPASRSGQCGRATSRGGSRPPAAPGRPQPRLYGSGTAGAARGGTETGSPVKRTGRWVRPRPSLRRPSPGARRPRRQSPALTPLRFPFRAADVGADGGEIALRGRINGNEKNIYIERREKKRKERGSPASRCRGGDREAQPGAARPQSPAPLRQRPHSPARPRAALSASHSPSALTTAPSGRRRRHSGSSVTRPTPPAPYRVAERDSAFSPFIYGRELCSSVPAALRAPTPSPGRRGAVRGTRARRSRVPCASPSEAHSVRGRRAPGGPRRAAPRRPQPPRPPRPAPPRRAGRG